LCAGGTCFTIGDLIKILVVLCAGIWNVTTIIRGKDPFSRLNGYLARMEGRTGIVLDDDEPIVDKKKWAIDLDGVPEGGPKPGLSCVSVTMAICKWTVFIL